MPLRTGTSTPWRQWEGSLDREDVVVLYVRDGDDPGAIDYLVEQIRSDGFAYTIGDAYRRAEAATLSRRWRGFVDEEPVFCTPAGETAHGDLVDEPISCVVAVMVDV